MSWDPPHLDYLEDILDAMEKVAQFIRGMTYEQFAHDDKTTFAVVRALEIIGEAAKRVPQQVLSNGRAHPRSPDPAELALDSRAAPA